MKTKVIKLCSLLMALLTMTSLLVACGSDENPFLGDWDDDAGEQSLIFLEDGTGAQTSYYVREGGPGGIRSREPGLGRQRRGIRGRFGRQCNA